MAEVTETQETLYSLVVRKPCFGLPTGCPSCLPAYIYLKLARIPFSLDYNVTYPDSDELPYFEAGDCVAYNNEEGGLIDCLIKDGVADLDAEVQSVPEWISTKAMLTTWLADALLYELFVASDSSAAYGIYYSELPWPLGKLLYVKQVHEAKQKLGITTANIEKKEGELYKRAGAVYEALFTRLGEHDFLFGNRPSSLDAIFLGHALITLHALPEKSALRSKLLEYSPLISFAERLKRELIDGSSTSTSAPPFHSATSSSAPRKGFSSWSSKPKNKPKKQKTDEEKTFRKRAKYFVAAQLIAVVLFFTFISRSEDGEMELDDGAEGYGDDY